MCAVWDSEFCFWATVCKMVRPMRLVCCLSVLSVTLVYCGQTVGCIKMKLGMQVGLGPGHIVLDGDPPPPPPKGHSPQFSTHICCGQMAGWIKMPLGMEVGLSPGDFVLDEAPLPLFKRGQSPPPPNFFFPPISVVAKWLDAFKCHLVWM